MKSWPLLAVLCLAGTCLAADPDWDEFDFNKLKQPILGGVDDPDNPNHVTDIDSDIPADALRPFNCSSVERRHHHFTCNAAFGYATHHCHCDWGQCMDRHRPHSWCGCPWGRCRQDRPFYCARIWKYCAPPHHHHHHHHHHGDDNIKDVIPGIQPRDLRPMVAVEDEFLDIGSSDLVAAPTAAAPTTKAPTTAAPTTAAPTEASTTKAAPTTAAPVTTKRPHRGCFPWGYTTHACYCPMGSCRSKYRPHGYCACPWGHCEKNRPKFCVYFWKFCPQPHCRAEEQVVATIGSWPSFTDEPKPKPDYTDTVAPVVQDTTPQPSQCGAYGVASPDCKCSWYKCRFWPHRPGQECGCPWGYCREDRPGHCRNEAPNPDDLRPTRVPRPTYHPRPRPTHHHHHHDGGHCGSFGVATRDCECHPGNCRADRPSMECGCPWGQCMQHRPYHCKWRGIVIPSQPPPPGPHDHHHGHHHHHHHHHHHDDDGQEAGWDQDEPSPPGPSGGFQMMLYGAMGFMICALGFLIIISVVSMTMRRLRRPPSTYRNLGKAPIEIIRNPMDNMLKKPEDKEVLVQ